MVQISSIERKLVKLEQEKTQEINVLSTEELNNESKSFARLCFDNTSNSIENSLSYDVEKKCNLQAHTSNFISRNDLSVFNNLTIRQISPKLPKWGGNIMLDFTHTDDFDGLEIRNSCTIDYILLGFWISSKISAPIASLMTKQLENNDLINSIIRIIHCIDAEEWNRAKTLWILEVLDMKPNNNNFFDLLGTEFEFFSKYLRFFQEIKFSCTSCSFSMTMKDLYFFKKNDVLNFSIFNTDSCKFCKIDLNHDGFIQTPFWLVVESLYNDSLEPILFTDVPKNFSYKDQNFQLLFGTMHSNLHFTSFFYLKNSFYYFDDLNHPMKARIPKKSILTTVYFLC